MPSSGLELILNEPTAIKEKIAGRLAETASHDKWFPMGPIALDSKRSSSQRFCRDRRSNTGPKELQHPFTSMWTSC